MILFQYASIIVVVFCSLKIYVTVLVSIAPILEKKMVYQG